MVLCLGAFTLHTHDKELQILFSESEFSRVALCIGSLSHHRSMIENCNSVHLQSHAAMLSQTFQRKVYSSSGATSFRVEITADPGPGELQGLLVFVVTLRAIGAVDYSVNPPHLVTRVSTGR